MDKWTKNNLSFALQIIVLILVTAFALTGPIISFVHQYHLIVEEFGKFIGGIFIFDSYASWRSRYGVRAGSAESARSASGCE